MGSRIVSQGMLLAALCSLSGQGSSFVPQQQALFGSSKLASAWASSCSSHSSCDPPCRKRGRVRVGTAARIDAPAADCTSGGRRDGRASGVQRGMRMDGTDMGLDTAEARASLPPSYPDVGGGEGGGGGGEVESFYLAELNFCLGAQDSVLSGRSITKALNTASNQILKNLLILNSPEDDGPAIRDVDKIESDFDAEFSESPSYSEAKAYLACVCQLAKEGCPAQEQLENLTEDYRMAFKRLAGVLSDFGCTVLPGKEGRIRPEDRDICLSILDYATPAEESTPTRALNTLANRVVRTVCVGADNDLQGLAREMESKRAKFMMKWIGKQWKGSQEDSFYDALVILVRNGLSDDPPALHGPYLNSFQRLMGIVVQEVGTRSTPASAMVLKSFFAWEREIRKELTEPAWESNPPDLVGSWALDTMGWDGLNDLPGDGLEVEDYGLHDLVVAFRKDGRVQVPAEAGLGLQWRVEPGPTHLDTVYFEMIPSAPKLQGASDPGAGGGTTMSYTGYVDRGARIEARFSKRFVKMTGRLTTVVRGQERPSTRFAMRLVERGEGKGLG